jgi:hypothetical protein
MRASFNNQAATMAGEISKDTIQSFQNQLENHPIYESVRTIENLRTFMEHHVYSVWDFMSLIKYLQAVVAPASYPWVPEGDGNVRRFINELVLEEESDEGFTPDSDSNTFSSHFELYCEAMKEIGADNQAPMVFTDTVRKNGIESGLSLTSVPEPSRNFTRTTFDFIESGKPHVVAAALALGREHIIPSMFRSFLKDMSVSEQDAPAFHYYLKRHIHLDEDFHAPLSLRLLNSLCEGDASKQAEAIDAAQAAVNARLKFWDGVLENIQSR